MTRPLKIVPLPAPVATNHDDAITKVVPENAGYPCRRCLTDGKPGEEMLLLSYDHFTGPSPYRGNYAIFLHKAPCALYNGQDIPEQQRSRLLAVRGFDEQNMMVHTEIMQGTELEDAARKIFADGNVKYLHIHYAAPGCFAVKLEPGDLGAM